VAVTPELGVACAAAGSTPRLTAHTATPVILRSFRMLAGSPICTYRTHRQYLPMLGGPTTHVGMSVNTAFRE